MTSAAPTTADNDAELNQSPPPRTITAELENLFQRVGEIATFPSVARKVLQVANDSDCAPDDLLAVIEQDPVLAFKILQTVNSSYYGLPHDVADLRTAITLLGPKQVRNMAMTVVVGRHYSKPSAVGSIDPAQMWDHSVATAAVARLIAQKTGVADPDEAYLSGLIHDAGLLVIDQRLESQMPRIMKEFKASKSWMAAEQEVLSFDHAQLGAYIAWRSGFPHRLVAAVDYHHCPTEATDDVAALAGLVSVANYLVSRLGHAVMAERRLPPPLDVIFDRLDLDRREIRQMWGELEESLEKAADLKTL